MQSESLSAVPEEVAAAPATTLDRFRAGIWRGLGIAVVASIGLLYAGSMSGYLIITVGEFPQLVDLWYWAYDNLRSSLLPFALVLLWFAHTLRTLRLSLDSTEPSYERVFQLDRRSDVLIGLFFGIGVIWTAIGMRSALIGALGDLDAQSAARLGAFGVLQALVEQGILLALSTTIVGGIGGYLLRVLKLLRVGPMLDRFYSGINRSHSNAVLERLEAIERAVREMSDAQPPPDKPEQPT